jgi:hypothetical protein
MTCNQAYNARVRMRCTESGTPFEGIGQQQFETARSMVIRLMPPLLFPTTCNDHELADARNTGFWRHFYRQVWGARVITTSFCYSQRPLYRILVLFQNTPHDVMMISNKQLEVRAPGQDSEALVV